MNPLPPGYKLIPVKTTYLEMKSKPETTPVAMPDECELGQWQKPEFEEYKKIFSAVGGEWGWSGRLIIKEKELLKMIRATTTEIFRLRCSGQTAGFVELDRSIPGQAEIVYFGLIPGFIGRGLGKFFLDWAIRKAWEGKTERVWLHTCQYDHPGALAVYHRAGFAVVEEQIETHPYPEEFIRRLSTAED
ncbi:MAG: GNAT family N-acetyltransferase [Candidatus Aminicenantes bacterium]|nr:GNAT family N-acetyltransferase [Candidatus Aminicenantes bacterium]